MATKAKTRSNTANATAGGRGRQADKDLISAFGCGACGSTTVIGGQKERTSKKMIVFDH